MATMYVSPTGAGDKSGSTSANAAAIGQIDAMIRAAGVGGTVELAADKGVYTLKAPISITGSGVTIRGANSDGSAGEAHFEGGRAAEWAPGGATGAELFRIQKGANDLTFENFQVNNVGTAFRVGGDVSNLTIRHMDADNVQRFFDTLRSGTNATATVDGLTIKDIDIEGFSKNAIRIKYDTNDVLIEDVRADSGRQDGDNFAMGVHLDDTAHDIVLRRVVMDNATHNAGSGVYWNGDGFASERGTYNVMFEDTVARGNTDGGYDLKSSNVTMLRALAEDNGRNYRIWGDDVQIIDSVALNPHVRGGSGSQAQLWIADGASVKLVGGTFADAGSKTKVIDNSGSIEIVGTTFVHALDGPGIVGVKASSLLTATVSKVATLGLNSQGELYSDGTALVAVAGERIAHLADGAIARVEAAATAAAEALAKAAADALAKAAADALAAAETLAQAEALARAETEAVAAAKALAEAAASSVKASDWLRHDSTAADQVFTATSKAEKFVFDQNAAGGVDVIKGFGANDLAVFKNKLGDGDGDGVTTFGKDKILQMENGGSLAIEGLIAGLRLLGQTGEGYVYGDAGAWKAGSTVPTLSAVTKHVSTTASESYVGTNARETFVFDTGAGKLGNDIVRGLGSDDTIVTRLALADGNRDGYATAGKNGFDLGDGASMVKVAGLGGNGLRALGQSEEGFVYADAAVRQKGWLEGKITVADTLAGAKGGVKADKFFLDTALLRDLGDDVVTKFGAQDIIITTSKLGTGAAGSQIAATDGAFTLGHGNTDLGSLAVVGMAGQAVTSLEFDGSKVVGGIEYFVYSNVGSAAGLDLVVG